MKNLALKKRRLGPDQSHCNQSRFWSILHTTLVQITRITPKWIYTVLKIFSLLRIFEQIALALKNRVCPEIFHCVQYISYHSGFFSNSALALKNKVCPKIFHCIKYTFCIQDFLATCACAEKQKSALNSLYWIYIFYSDVRWGSWLGRHSLFQSQICQYMNWMWVA